MSEPEADAKAIFLAALECEGAEALARFLDQAWAADAVLRHRVEELLEAHRNAGEFLGGVEKADATHDDPVPERPSTMIGPYKLIEPIGEGGMGTVWMAQQTMPVKRLVALKLVKAGMASKQVIARFEAERQALALMDHSNIAKVLDGGTTGAGRPYFVMDLVKGVPITRYCDDYHLTPRQRLELFLPVCQAVQHAHQKGIIHRDLKPSNVLVALYDGKPVPKVIDFGVAKAAGQPLTDKTLITGFGAIVGTLEYMSPEQAEINQLDIDTRSDIYSLGVLLYELLTGSPPFSRKELEKTGLLEMLRVIREQEPTKPSTKLSTAEGLPTLAANRGTEPAKLTRLVRGELDWIVMKALEKDRNRRYETANGFAADVRRYLNDEPVQACPPSVGYRLHKFVRRNKAAVAAGAVVALGVLVAVVGLVISNVRIDREKTQTEREKKEKETALTEAEANLLLARQSVDDIYRPMADQLAVLQHMQPYQRDVLEKTLHFYQEFARRKSSDPAIRVEAASASLAVLGIKWHLGHRDLDYEQAYREEIARLRQLAEELPSDPKRRGTLAGACSDLANVLHLGGRREEAEKHYRQALALYRELAAERPDVPDRCRRLAVAHNTLGGGLQDRPNEAEQCHREAIRLCEALAAERPEDPLHQGERARSYYMLGHVLAGTNRSSDAAEAYRQAIAICEKAGQPLARTTYRSLTAAAQYHLAQLLMAEGRTEAAEAAYRQAVASAEWVASRYPDIPSYRRTLAVYSLVLASHLGRTGRPDQAAPFTRQALELKTKLQEEHSEENQPSRKAITELLEWGRMLRLAGELKEAIPLLRRAVEMAKKLAAESPTDVGAQNQLAACHYSAGVALQWAGRQGEAADEYRQELAIYEKLAAAFPAEPDYRFKQSSRANFLGIALRRHQTRDPEAPLPHHRLAIKLCDQLVAQFPDRPRYRLELARSHYALGLARAKTGRWAEMEASLTQALTEGALVRDEYHNPQRRRAQPAPVNGEPKIPSMKNDLAWLLATCPDTKLRDPARAVKLAKQAVEGDPRPSYWNTLGVSQYRAGHGKEALAALQQSMDLAKGGDSFDWFFVAMARARLNDGVEARKWYDKAVAWMEKNQPRNDELRRFRAEAEELLGVRKTEP